MKRRKHKLSDGRERKVVMGDAAMELTYVVLETNQQPNTLLGVFNKEETAKESVNFSCHKLSDPVVWEAASKRENNGEVIAIGRIYIPKKGNHVYEIRRERVLTSVEHL